MERCTCGAWKLRGKPCTTHPQERDDTDLAVLAEYANPDCRVCHGVGHVGADPCDRCMVGVWL